MRRGSKSISGTIALIAGLLLVLGGLYWVNYQYTGTSSGPNQFLVNWMGHRGFLTQGINPYSEERMLEIQQAAYQRPAADGEPDLRMVSPLFSLIVYWPFALIADYSTARALWMVLLEAALFGLAYVSTKLVNWKPGLGVLILYFVFGFTWYHGLTSLLDGNDYILAALALTGALLAFRSGGVELTGVLMALAMIKPGAVLLPIIYILLWAVKHRHVRLLTWFGTSLLLLGAASTLLMPDWIFENLRAFLRPEVFHFPDTPVGVLSTWMPAFGNRIGIALSALVSIILLLEWLLGLKEDFRGLLWTFSLTLVLGQWIGIPGGVDQFIILLPSLTLVFALLSERWKIGGDIFSTLMMTILLAGFWGIYFSRTSRTSPQVAMLLFPLPLILLVMLYWVRWWAFRPPHLWFDGITNNENFRL